MEKAVASARFSNWKFSTSFGKRALFVIIKWNHRDFAALTHILHAYIYSTMALCTFFSFEFNLNPFALQINAFSLVICDRVKYNEDISAFQLHLKSYP